MVVANRVCHSRRSDRCGRRNTFPFKRPILVFLKKDMPYKELEETMPSPSISHRPSLGNPPASGARTGAHPRLRAAFALSFTIKVNIFLKKVTGLFFYPIDLFSCVAYDEAK